MAILISNGPNNLSTANAFYRVEAANLSSFGASGLSLSSARNLAVTFANAGNCKGVVLSLAPTSALALLDRSVVVTLQQFVAGSWVNTAATVTLTAAQINNGVATAYSNGNWIVPFEFATPVAVTTAGSTWRFNISQTGGTTGTWVLGCSDAGVNPFYATWCDTLATYTSGDQIICKDKIIVDTNCTFNGIAVTGDATKGFCGVMCRATNKASPEMLEWQNPPAASYTMTMKGVFIMSSDSAFRAGTSASRIPTAQKAKIYTDTPNIGAINSSNFVGFATSSGTSNGFKLSFYCYGEVPAVNRTTFTNNANVGTTAITSAVATGWNIGDLIRVGRKNTAGGTNTTNHTISNIVGTAITIAPALAGFNRVAGGTLIRTGGCGIEFRYVNSGGSAALSLQHVVGYASNFVLDGVDVIDMQFSFSQNASADDPAFTSQWLVQDVNKLIISDFRTLFNVVLTPPKGLYINRLNAQAGFMTSHFGSAGDYIVNDCYFHDVNRHGFQPTKHTISNNVIENASDIFLSGSAINITHTNNRYWGLVWAIRPVSMINATEWKGNYYDRCAYPLAFGGSVVAGVKMENEVYGSISVNTADIIFISASYVDFEIANPTGNMGISNQHGGAALSGSIVKISNYNAASNDDRCFLPEGNFQRTGYGLGDTTVRTSGTTFGAASAGKFAMRFQPVVNPAGVNLKWSQNIPTGNIQNKTMTVSVWVKINNAAYYAGTHTKPTLKINYDNGTVVSAVAAGDASAGQLLSITFTPTTTYGQITMSIEGMTDATGTNSYFYIDDVNVAYPAGVSLDAGSLDLWASALPVMPTIATFPSLGGVWDEPISAHTISGSFGQLLPVKTDDSSIFSIIR